MAPSQQLRFIRMRCSIEISFWSAVTDKILNEWKGSDRDHRIYGVYGWNREATPRLTFDAESLSPPNRSAWTLAGTLKILPNRTSWDRFDAGEALRQLADGIWADIDSDRFLDFPQVLSQFILVLYADVKQYQFQYWFGLPAIAPRLPIVRRSSESITAPTPPDALRQRLTASSSAFFAVRLAQGEIVATFELNGLPERPDGIVFAYVDPTTEMEFPTWLLRNFIAAVARRYGSGPYTFLCIKRMRPSFAATLESVAVDAVQLASLPRPAPSGWELNHRHQPGPRSVDLSSAMDPVSRARSSVDLNLRLMKWREFPALDLDLLNRLKVLIVGAGTLGCDVARNLAAWGVCHFTFIDNGTVSFSNPTRQSLYSYDDCLDKDKKKAIAAADAMKRISPSIQAEGHVSTVPMVGHPLGQSLVTEAAADFHLLKRCIDDSDLVFLLTDSRESRWLPTLLCSAANKPLINCALGFDTFVVIRHGVQIDADRRKLGCYFCADVTAPGDSISDRTLDRQCTVTRPGVGSIASAMAVEMAISLVHQPDCEPAPTGTSFSWAYDRKDSLGLVPHQLRGWLAQFHVAIVKNDAYPGCVACSEPVISRFDRYGWEFVQDVVNDPARLEEICGITDLNAAAERVDWELDE